MWLFPENAEARRRKYRRAQREYKRAQRLVRRGRYRRAIRKYRKVIRILTGNSRRAVKGRWESLFRIAVLQRRLRNYRASRNALERLWDTSPSPASRYHRRLNAQFSKLKGKLLSELILTISPSTALATVQDSSGAIQPRKVNQRGQNVIKSYDLQKGTINISLKAPGYTAISRRTILEQSRSVKMVLALRRLTGYDYALSLYNHATQLRQQARYLQAYRWFEETRRALLPNLIRQPNGESLNWQTLLTQAEVLIQLKRDSDARRQYRTLWTTYPQRRGELRRSMCQLKEKYQWAFPRTLSRVRCGIVDPPTTPKKTRQKSLSAASWVLIGIGAVGIIVGVVAHVQIDIARGERDAFVERGCYDATCEDFVRTDDAYRAWIATTWIGYASGGVAISAGLLIYFITPDKTAKTNTQPHTALPIATLQLHPNPQPKK